MKEFIRIVKDYPVAGVNFYDLNSLFADQQLFKRTVSHMATIINNNTTMRFPTHIAGLESRGFVIGAAVAHELGLPFVMIRKEGSKYPGNLLIESYDTEYSTDTIVLQEGLLGHTSRVVLVDDLIATGGSMMAAKRLVEQTGAQVVHACAIIDLKYTHADDFDMKVSAVETSYSEGEIKHSQVSHWRDPSDFEGIT